MDPTILSIAKFMGSLLPYLLGATCILFLVALFLWGYLIGKKAAEHDTER